MKRLLGAAMLVITSANAQYVPNLAPIPPVEYDHKFNGNLIYSMQESTDAIKIICKNPKAWACAYTNAILCNTPGKWGCDTNPLTCVVFIWSGATSYQIERMKKHEIGHCNGWPGDHPGARFENMVVTR